MIIAGRPTLFHVSGQEWREGEEIGPGNWGRQTRQFRPGGPALPQHVIDNLFWEVGLEAARKAMRPNAPSRLSCAFAWEAFPDAKRFRDERRPGCHIWMVQPTVADAPSHRGSFDLLSKGDNNASYADFIPEKAVRYWSEEPHGLVEVLLACSVRLVTKIP